MAPRENVDEHSVIHLPLAHYQVTAELLKYVPST